MRGSAVVEVVVLCEVGELWLLLLLMDLLEVGKLRAERVEFLGEVLRRVLQGQQFVMGCVVGFGRLLRHRVVSWLLLVWEVEDGLGLSLLLLVEERVETAEDFLLDLQRVRVLLLEMLLQAHV